MPRNIAQAEIPSWNDRAHEIDAELLDTAEDWLVKKGVCEPHEAIQRLTMELIATQGGFLEHGQVYLESEGRIGAGIFLSQISKASSTKLRAAYERKHRICDQQLHWHTAYYFRDYHSILRRMSLHLLAALPSIDEIHRNGTLQLAAANLPGIRTDIRRELRSRGATQDRLIVPTDVMNNRIQHNMANMFGGIELLNTI